MALATPEDLATHLGVDLDAAEAVRAAEVIDQASTVVEGYVHQRLEQVRETVTVAAAGETLVLPSGLVSAVHSVTVDGVALASGGYRWEPAGLVQRVGARWRSTELVAVDYTHGFADVPADVQLAVLTVARELWEGAYPRTFAPNVEGNATMARSYPSRMLASGWKELVNRYRLVSVA